MNIALIFPGQGSQYVGMGQDFFENSEVSKSVFLSLDEITKSNLSELIFSGSEETLALTTNSQPAIMSVSIAIYRFLENKGYLNHNLIRCVAGHSLGEYSALVVNRSISYEDSVKLLMARSIAMQECMPVGTGGMAAVIGQSETQITNIIDNLKKIGRLFIANDNADGQIVLSGDMKAIDYLVSNSKLLEVRRAIKLPVSAPFHCELIQSAAKTFENKLNDFNFLDFKYPFYSNVTAKKENSGNIKNLLSQQIVNKVRWREIIENMNKEHIDLFIEIGPGKVLTNLIKRSSKNVEAVSISKMSDLDILEKYIK